MTEPPIVVENLVRHFGSTRAVDGVSFDVEAGTVLGLLGPNGAGKTTVVRMLATLLTPDSGTARVCGHDVVGAPDLVRADIGLAGQYAAVDELLTGVENLTMVGRLYGLSKRDAVARSRELIDRFDLTDAGDRPVKTYSGGMRRRLDLAASLVIAPPVLFLDEPTTGLDPRSRLTMWAVIERLVDDGTTVLLTTQYLEEADQLADRVVVIDHGRIIADGTPDELKSTVGGSTLAVRVRGSVDVEVARTALAAVVGAGRVTETGEREPVLHAAFAEDDAHLMARAIEAAASAGAQLEDIEWQRPSMDDVFLKLTGAPASADDGAADAATTDGGAR